MHLADLAKQDSFLLHINHASLLIKHQGRYLLCDPWYVSPAFGSWTQNPPPRVELIEFILSLDPKDLSVVVSHGHDDHLDDYFIKYHLAKSNFFVPAFRSTGLVDRVTDLIHQPPELLSDVPLCCDRTFGLSRLINDEFTSYDAIIIIETSRFTVIHANDNWHSQPQTIVSKLLEIKRRCKGEFFYLSQLGIADCFPQCYPQYSSKELVEISEQRLRTAISATESNLRSLSLVAGYSYANQSKIVSQSAKADFFAFEIIQKMLDNRNNSNPSPQIIQLVPGSYIDLLQPTGQAAILQGLETQGLIDELIARLERKANSYIGVIAPGPVSLRTIERIDDRTISRPGVVYAADSIVWQRILTGAVTIETISIGGSGVIYKTPREFNIRELHEKMGNFGYLAQHKFKSLGLSWLDAEP